jgi:cytochrome c oxidase cbb3-type subunit 1
MTAGEGGLVFLFAITAVTSLIGAAKAEDTAFAFHAYLAAGVAAVAIGSPRSQPRSRSRSGRGV